MSELQQFLTCWKETTIYGVERFMLLLPFGKLLFFYFHFWLLQIF